MTSATAVVGGWQHDGGMNQQPLPSKLPVSHHATVAPPFSALMLVSGLGWNELARRCGYRNLAEGCRRLQAFAQRRNIALRPAD